MDEVLNHHNDPTGLLQSASEADSNLYLGSHSVVDSLVRDFVSVVISRFESVASGVLTPEDAANQDRDLCLHMGKIMLGREGGYRPMSHWNDGALPSYVRNKMASSIQTNEEDESVMAQVFALLTHTIYDQIRNVGTDHEPMVGALNEAIQSVVLLLLGVEQYE